MGLIDLKYGKLTVPLYDIGAIATGFYAGYSEGKGIYMGPFVEYLTKYGPTALAVTVTPVMIKVISDLSKCMGGFVNKNLRDSDLEVMMRDGSNLKYGNLSEKQRQDIAPKVTDTINNLESKLIDVKYLKPTLHVGAITAVETAIGYVAGRLYSQIN